MILEMPNNPEPTTTRERLQTKIDLTKGRIWVDMGFHIAGIRESIPHLSSAADLYHAVKIYGNHTTGNLKVDKEEAEEVFAHIPAGKRAMVHAEGETLTEIMLPLAKKYDVPLHVAHVSLASEVDAILKAKEEGYDVTGEVAPHHLEFTDHDVDRLGEQSNMKPPFGKDSDRKRVREAITKGRKPILEIVATDHAPHDPEEKKKGAFGVTGLETVLPYMMDMHLKGEISYQRLMDFMYRNPQRIFNLRRQWNTHVLIDPKQTTTIDASAFQSKAKSSPFDGRTFQGKIVDVTLRGQQIYNGEHIVGTPRGTALLPQ